MFIEIQNITFFYNNLFFVLVHKLINNMTHSLWSKASVFIIDLNYNSFAPLYVCSLVIIRISHIYLPPLTKLACIFPILVVIPRPFLLTDYSGAAHLIASPENI